MWLWLRSAGRWCVRVAVAYGPDVVRAIVARRAARKRASIMLVMLCLFAAPVAAQTSLVDKVDQAVAAVAPLLDRCADGMEYVPTYAPGVGVTYACRPVVQPEGRDKLADRLTELNAGLIIIDSTLTGYLVWNQIGEEANPLMKPIYAADKPWRVGVKGALGAAQMIGIYRVTKPRSKRRYTTLAVAIAINAYACINNYLIYRDHRATLR